MTSPGVWTSRRERTLWFLALAVVFGILVTIPVGSALAGAIPDEVVDVVFALALGLIVAAIVTEGLRRRPRVVDVGIGLGLVAVGLLVLVRMSIPAERTHLIEYAVLALILQEAFLERRSNGRAVWSPAVFGFLAASAVGIVDEFLQLVHPDRVFDMRDIVFNTLAAAFAVALRSLAAHVRHSNT